MKKTFLLIAIALSLGIRSHAQEIQTVFRGGRVTGWGALTNKFTTLNGEFANIAGVYGGVYFNQKFFLGIEGSGVTNDISVLPQYSVDPARNLSYAYGQCGLVTEYALGSNKAIHAVFHLFTGAGLTVQYNRYHWDDDPDDGDDYNPEDHDENWFFVAEPGVQLEVNMFRWMRFSPGVTYRKAMGSTSKGLSDDSLSDWSYNITLKFGKF
ncbi:MAG TPA: hypothetical protein VGK59_10805 [Ohtaekwangia sp.]